MGFVMKILIKALTYGCLAITSTSILAAPFGEKVNCKNKVVGTQYIYYGNATCRINNVEYSEYVNRSYTSSYTVSKTINGVRKSCFATLSNFKPEDIIKEVCEYKPVAYIKQYPIEESANGVIEVRGADYDGSIVKTELWIDGVKQSSTTKTLFGNHGDTFQIKAVVTDNDGYTTVNTSTATLKYLPYIPF